jgi:hypothetical protein
MDEGFTVEMWVRFTSFLAEGGSKLNFFLFDSASG